MAISTHRGNAHAHGWRPDPRQIALAMALLASIAVISLAATRLLSGGSGSSLDDSPPILTAGASTVAMNDGTQGVLLPEGWAVNEETSPGVLEVFASEATSNMQARLLISHGPGQVLPLEPSQYSESDVYTPLGGVEGSRYVAVTNDRTGAYIVAFAVPLEDGSFLTGQGVIGAAATPEMRAELLAVSESAAQR